MNSPSLLYFTVSRRSVGWRSSQGQRRTQFHMHRPYCTRHAWFSSAYQHVTVRMMSLAKHSPPS